MSMLGVGNSVADHVLEEDLEDAASGDGVDLGNCGWMRSRPAISRTLSIANAPPPSPVSHCSPSPNTTAKHHSLRHCSPSPPSSLSANAVDFAVCPRHDEALGRRSSRSPSPSTTPALPDGEAPAVSPGLQVSVAVSHSRTPGRRLAVLITRLQIDHRCRGLGQAAGLQNIKCYKCVKTLQIHSGQGRHAAAGVTTPLSTLHPRSPAEPEFVLPSRPSLSSPNLHSILLRVGLVAPLF
nr:hypothetical protein Iba_chr07bCG11850 [Ipomoea batatas]